MLWESQGKALTSDGRRGGEPHVSQLWQHVGGKGQAWAHQKVTARLQSAVDMGSRERSSGNTYVDWFRVLYSVPLVYLSTFVLLPHWINYCGININLWNWYINSSLCSFPSKISWSFLVHTHFSISLAISFPLSLAQLINNINTKTSSNMIRN